MYWGLGFLVQSDISFPFVLLAFDVSVAIFGLRCVDPPEKRVCVRRPRPLQQPTEQTHFCARHFHARTAAPSLQRKTKSDVRLIAVASVFVWSWKLKLATLGDLQFHCAVKRFLSHLWLKQRFGLKKQTAVKASVCVCVHTHFLLVLVSCTWSWVEIDMKQRAVRKHSREPNALSRDSTLPSRVQPSQTLRCLFDALPDVAGVHGRSLRTEECFRKQAACAVFVKRRAGRKRVVCITPWGPADTRQAAPGADAVGSPGDPGGTAAAPATRDGGAAATHEATRKWRPV